ncbi:Uncharacterized conserved protein, contains ParB-like and HNH nuclease domains [Pedobacter sp. ok626]|uniref:DUF262 domain-containing protein n=1 Tax=Pedobacter sp. ok626 TaxID=1761882 RepID=UPI00088E3972|nr:DUF262 domain-containing protein [Pedobacter sp. ok626]SDK92760.1 Uncharacterized conserved protein, contains ParB-like and HNH nuclease domains [Pedobacter sp. ok626]
MDAGKRTINDIFNGNRILEIPFFQRAYVWGTDQWERLLEDMESVSVSNKPYFLGSVILKQQPTHTGNGVGDVRTVIDGQQRLTTLNLFFKVLCLKNGQTNLFDRIFRLISTNHLALLHNHNDIETFNEVLNLTELKDIAETDNIIKAYSYFKEHIDPEKYNIQNILGRILFVGIDLDTNEDEQQIFDTINSLGVRLTTAELLKNYFFNRDELAHYNEFWKNIFEKDDETKNYWDKEITTGRLKRTFIDLFFYSYLQIKIQDNDLKVKTEDKIEFSKVETLFESYKSLIKDYDLNKKDVLAEIKEYAQLFKENLDYDIIHRELTADFGIERINAIIFGLDTSTLIPYVLYILKNIQEESQKNDLFELIESYIMRRMIVHATTKNYNHLFTDRLISNKILSKEQFREYIEKSSDKVNYLPNNQEVKIGFDNAYLVNKQSAGIIYLIESKIRNRNKQATQLLGISKYSLEHLMPKKWENYWGKLNNKEERDFRNRKLYTLGNLAIITQSLNASIRDSNWKIKKKGKLNKEGLIHYSAGIETLAPYLELDEWNENEIQKRAAFLYDKAIEIWESEEITIENANIYTTSSEVFN